MADGTARDIDDIQIGDLVLAADPDTGDVTAEPVTDLIIGSGEKDLVTITADPNGDGHPDHLTATTNHPFYADGRWTNAGNLVAGDRLTTDTWTTYPANSVVRRAPQHATVYNLTIADLHTYYVLLDDAPTLVHNCGNSWARDVVNHWDRGSFPNRLQSLRYHYAKHGRPGESFKDYARRGVNLSRRVGSTGRTVRVRGRNGGMVGPYGRTYTAY